MPQAEGYDAQRRWRGSDSEASSEQAATFDAAAFYRAAVHNRYEEMAPQTLGQQESFGQGGGHYSMPASSPRESSRGAGGHRQTAALFNPPAPPGGASSAEDHSEYVRALFHYMHNLHQQKVKAYELLQQSHERQTELESENRILKGLIGIPHYDAAETQRVELAVSHYPRLELRWVDNVLGAMPRDVSGGSYIIWRAPPGMQVWSPSHPCPGSA